MKWSIYNLVKAEDRLDTWIQQKTVDYLEEFFKSIKDEKKYQADIVQKCRG